jgi:hypothetical protein
MKGTLTMNLNRKLRLSGLVLTLIVLLGFALVVGRSVANQGADLLTYLPSIIYQPPPPRGIYGLVTQNGVPTAGITVTLQLREGSDTILVESVTTDANGNYSFLNAPTLGSGQRYFVFYPNAENVASRLSFWAGFLIDGYTAGDEVPGTDFDIANITLVNPPPAAVVTLPTTFTWNPRPATPGDSYELNLIGDEPEDEDETYFYTNPPLGYVNSYTLDTLPDTMVYDETYAWTVWAYGPGGTFAGGNFGASYLAYVFTFVESAAPSHIPTVPAQIRNSPELAFQRLAP